MWLEDEVTSWEDRYILSRYLYGVAEETIDDKKYTSLHKNMVSKSLLPEYTSRSWSSDPVPVALLTKYDRVDLIKKYNLTDRTESIPSIGSFDEMAEQLQPVFEPGFLSQKMDGWNYQVTYNSHGKYKLSNTRGRTGDPVFMDTKLPCIPDSISVRDDDNRDHVIVGEVSLDEDAFEELKRMFPNLPSVSQRSSVATAIANPSAHHLLSFRAFDIKGVGNAEEIIPQLKEWGFDTPFFTRVENYFDLYGLIVKYGLDERVLKQSTDGLVFWKASGGFKVALRVGHWEEKTYQSFVVGYIESYNTHNVSQSLEIYPILREGATQRQVNITNWRRIIDNNLEIGSPIAFIVKSDSTADIDEVVTRQLQKEFEGKYEIYKHQVMAREYKK